MRIFSDDLHDWASYTYEVFVPERVQNRIYNLANVTTFIEKEGVGEFELVARRWNDNLVAASFVPDVEPVRTYTVPFEVLQEALDGESAEDVENILIGAGEYGVLLEGE